MNLAAFFIDLPLYATVRTGIVLIDRFHRAAVRDPAGYDLLGFMDMSQRHIIVPQIKKLPAVDRHMPLVSPMEQQDLMLLSARRKGRGVGPAADFPRVIATAVHRCGDLGKLYTLDLTVQERMDILRPAERPVIGIRLQIIMISDDKHDLGGRQLPQTGIYLLQFPKERLSVEQIPRDQKQICFSFLTQLRRLLQTGPDLSCPIWGVRASCVRFCSQMHVCDVDESHLALPLPVPVYFLTAM